MNCPNCGNAVQNGAAFCPFCNVPFSQSYPQQNYNYQQPAAPAQYPGGGYPGGYAPQTPAGYPGAYQDPRSFAQSEPDPLVQSIKELPREFLHSFRAPTEVLYGFVQKNDLIPCAIVLGVTLLLTFFAGLAVSSGIVSAFTGIFAQLAGLSSAGLAGSAQQGISLITERVSLSIGGIAALCQLICMLVTGFVFFVYINLIRKNNFSLTVLISLVAVSSFPTIVGCILCMIASFISPVICLLIMALSTAMSYLQLGIMLGCITGGNETQMFPAKSVVTLVCLLLCLALVALVGGKLLGNVFINIFTMISSGVLI